MKGLRLALAVNLPNVQIYDHDHDFRDEGGLGAMYYKTSPVKIGNGVWIGVNTIVLRGTEIGDNCVIGVGSVISGTFPAGSVIIQKRHTEIPGGGYRNTRRLCREMVNHAA